MITFSPVKLGLSFKISLQGFITFHFLVLPIQYFCCRFYMLLIHPISFEVILSFNCLVIFVSVFLGNTVVTWICQELEIQALISVILGDGWERGGASPQISDHQSLQNSVWNNHTQNPRYFLTEKQHWVVWALNRVERNAVGQLVRPHWLASTPNRSALCSSFCAV